MAQALDPKPTVHTPAGAFPSLAAGGAHQGDRGAGQQGRRAPRAPVVAGHVPDRRRLLLHPRLPARHRRPGRRRPLARRHADPRPADPLRRPADLPPRGRGEPARRGLDRHARAAARLVAGQALRPRPARVRRHRLHHHDHPVGRRRHRPPRREPLRPGAPARPRGRRHPGPARPARGGLPQGLQGGHRHRGGPGRRSTWPSTPSWSAYGLYQVAAHPQRARRLDGPALSTAHGNPLVDGRRRPAACSRSWRWACPASRPAWPSCRWSRATPADTPRAARRAASATPASCCSTAAADHERLPDHAAASSRRC